MPVGKEVELGLVTTNSQQTFSDILSETFFQKQYSLKYHKLLQISEVIWFSVEITSRKGKNP